MKLISTLKFFLPGLILTLVAAGLLIIPQPAAAQVSPLHPTFPLLDEDGGNVLETGKSISTMETCGACHDTKFIESHSFHANVGLDSLTAPGQTVSGRAWDTSPGFFGDWNPITYRYLSPPKDEIIDLGTPEWIQILGVRHAGGGPATTSRGGIPLQELTANPKNPETSILDPETGELLPWDWSESGVVEMNCFLCHTPNPNNEARIEALHRGEFGWANSATLLGSGVITQTKDTLTWNPAAFDGSGELRPEFVALQDPENENCGLCHGLVHDEVEDPLVMVGCSPDRWSTITTGQIVSPQRLADSGMNLANKEELNRSWDIHTERLLDCTDCHFSLNNPVYYQEAEGSGPEHLTFDPRRMENGEYLLRPLHEFARGQSAQGTVAPELKDTMRRCESCHDANKTHQWLPYQDRHMQAVSCETCHIPKMYSSANQQYDWTVIHTDGSARTDCRGVEGDPGTVATLLVGYEPALLPRLGVDGNASLAPYNLITSWYWIYGDPARPVRLSDLEKAYLENGEYHAGIMLRFDSNKDDYLTDDELIIDTPEKKEFVAQRLSLMGLENPRIVGEIQPYSINHTVTNGDWALKDCQACHSNNSRLTQPFQLASYVPGGVLPEFVPDANVALNGEIQRSEDGSLIYLPNPQEEGFYILGQDAVGWIDLLGALMFVGVLAGISTHGGLRFAASLKRPKHQPKIKKVYMYHVYERLWHWLQTFAIVILLFTGLVIHKPDTFGIFSFRGVVIVHNVLAGILAVNAFLSLFYHVASGEIQQYLPRPRGFFDQAIEQAKFYLLGIFRGAEHPFEKTARKKLNPLQQVTYFGILNVFLPLQGITGILMWGAQRWPEIAEGLGGLPFLAPLHTLTAWTFAAFIVAHVYLTTTGHAPLAGIKAMIMGWDEVEIHAQGDDPGPMDGSTLEVDPIPTSDVAHSPEAGNQTSNEVDPPQSELELPSNKQEN